MNSNDSDKMIVKSTSDILETTYTNLIKGITGLATADKKELIFSVSRVLQNVRAINLLDLLKKEWDYWLEKGKIKEDYTTTEQHLDCLHELLDFLDIDIPDELRFITLKKILLVAASETISNRDEVLPHQFIKICKKLASGEIIVLLTAYRLAKEYNFKYNGPIAVRHWLEIIASNSPLKHVALVELHEENLITLKLLYDSTFTERIGFQISRQFRLTDLGIDFCKYVEEYDTIKP